MKTHFSRLLLASTLILNSIGFLASYAQVNTPINFALFNPDCCDCKATSKTFFTVRPAFQLNSPEFLANFHDRLHAAGKECYNGAIQIVPFGGQSTNSCDLASYFMFDCKKRLHITELQTNTTDILAHQLNIFTQGGLNPSLYTPFESYIEFRPQYTFAGVGITYKQELGQFCDGRGFWILVSSPITYVSTEMKLCETIISDGGGVAPTATGAVANATDAFQQSSWQFGRIESCTKNKVKLGDITLLLGYEIVNHERCHAEGYAGVLIPTGNKVKSELVFEPMVGHNHHTGIITGASGGIVLSECPESDTRWSVEFDTHGLFLFKRCETRSFDLKRKPWSRYMQVYANQDQAQQAYNFSLTNPTDTFGGLVIGTPGINVFTKPLRVHPGFTSVSNLALLYDHCCWQCELGYNFYARQAECVELAKPWQTGPALKSFAEVTNFGGVAAGTTDSVQIIGNVFGDVNAVAFIDPTTRQIEYDNNLIQASDLDLLSAAHPAVISHTIYASGSYRFDDRPHPVFVALGGSYEFASDNTSMDRWMVWFKTGVSF